MINSQTINESRLKAKKALFIAIWLFSILGSWSVLPYTLYLNAFPSEVAFSKIFLLTTIQSSILFGFVCWFSYLIIPKTGLLPFSLEKPHKTIIFPGALAGIAVGFIIYLLDISLFKNSMLSGVHPPTWAGLMASLYGGVNEEVLLRLFMFSLFFFLFKKIFKFELQSRVTFLWITNIIVAIIFGLGHLPAAFKLTPASPFEIFRVLLLNGIPGIVFGWLYWSRGLWACMFAHFIADLVIHVFLIG